jgi:hypothetical protein
MAGWVEVNAPVAVGDAGLLRGLRRSQRQHGLLGRVDIVATWNCCGTFGSGQVGATWSGASWNDSFPPGPARLTQSSSA